MIKLCEDCKYCKNDNCYDYEFAQCNHPKNFERTFVSENSGSLRYKYCSTHRGEGFIAAIILNMCGKRGRWFEEKETERESKRIREHD